MALVTYGGRAYDNALAEMCELLTKNNFKPAAGGAFLCRHVFSDKLAAGRPDAADLSELRMLAQGVARKLRSEGEIKPPKVPGDAQAAYCPTGAKKFDDPDFLSHTAMLEQYYTEERKENAYFL